MALVQSHTSSRWEAMFGLDYRSLALARVMLGLLIVCDLLLRATDLSAHYTDDGIHPREYAFAINGFYVCLHMMNGEWSFQAMLFLIHGIIALAFTVGYHTRISAFLLWLLTASLAARNQYILYGGYVMMRLLTVWFVFLPSGRAWSLDSALQKDPSSGAPVRRSPWHVSGFSVAFLLQMAVLYASSAWHKTGKEWREDGTAAWYAISLDYFRWGLGDWLLNQPTMLAALTFATLYWELYAPFLFFSPISPQWMRLFSAFGFWSLHFGLALALRLSVFLPTFTTALVTLLPAMVWDSLLIPYFSTHARLRLRIQYDPSSSFATLLAQLSRFVLFVPQVSVSHLTGDIKDVHFRVFAPPVQYTETSQAIAAVLSHSPVLWPLAPLFRLPIVVLCVDHFAQAQYEKDKHRRASLSSQQPQRSIAKLPAVRILKRMSVQFLGVLLAVCVLSWCMGNVGYEGYSTPENARPFLLWLHLDQQWNLFAPRPPPTNFWYTIPGELSNGTQIELFANNAFFDQHIEPAVDPDKYRPVPFADHFINSRWYKWFENINEGREEILLPFGRWICRNWNRKYSEGERLYQYKIWVIYEWNHLNGTHPRAGSHMLWWHVCYDKETPAPTDENGNIIQNEEEIKPLRDELTLDEVTNGNNNADQRDPNELGGEEGNNNGEQREEAVESEPQQRPESPDGMMGNDDAEAEAAEQEPDEPVNEEQKEARRLIEDRKKLRSPQEQQQAARAEEAAERIEKRDAIPRVVAEQDQDKPFRRPIERLKELEDEDRQRNFEKVIGN